MDRLQSINCIELQGNVGSVRFETIANKIVARFSLATNYVYHSDLGDHIETTWHNCVCFSGNVPEEELRKLEKGKSVHLQGRLRAYKHINADGVECMNYEVFVGDLEVWDGSWAL